MKLHSAWPPLRPSPLALTCFPIDGEDYDEVGVDDGQEKKFEVFKRNLNENLTTYHVCGLAHRSAGQSDNQKPIFYVRLFVRSCDC